jgi:hypothetical protein
MWDIGDKPEHDPLNNNNYMLISETYTQTKKDIVWGFYISKNINIIIII